MRVKYNNRFFATREEAKAFQKEHGCGVLYSCAKRSRTKQDYAVELAVALDARGEVVDPAEKPYVVAWNEYEV